MTKSPLYYDSSTNSHIRHADQQVIQFVPSIVVTYQKFYVNAPMSKRFRKIMYPVGSNSIPPACQALPNELPGQSIWSIWPSDVHVQYKGHAQLFEPSLHIHTVFPELTRGHSSKYGKCSPSHLFLADSQKWWNTENRILTIRRTSINSKIDGNPYRHPSSFLSHLKEQRYKGLRVNRSRLSQTAEWFSIYSWRKALWI